MTVSQQNKWKAFACSVIVYLMSQSNPMGVAGSVDDESNPMIIRVLCDQNVRNYRLLTPQQLEDDLLAKNQQRNCICNMVHQAPWGEPKIQIDCSAMDLHSDHFLAKTLPFGTQTLDVSWNGLDSIPTLQLNLEQLQIYRLHNNNVGRVLSSDLVNLTYLNELDLSNNAIETIEFGAFKDLGALKHLNLAYNNIRTLPENIFRPLRSILHLTLSGNDLNELFIEKNLFYNFQANKESLQILELEYCHLTWLSVESGSALNEVRLRGNAFFKQLPVLSPNIKLLDLSANPVRRLDTHYDGQLNNMEILLLEDMPNFYLLDVSSLATFRSLRKISLQNSKNFTYLDELAFDMRESAHSGEDKEGAFEHLNEIILTGTNVRKLSEKLFEYIQPEVIALDGCPIVCDCDLKWLMGKRVDITTNGICEKPLSMRNKRIDETQPEDVKNCSNFSKIMFKIMHGFLILIMILLCAVAMYYLVVGCRPSKKFYIRQRMGMNSPYSRITVEPLGQTYRPTTISQT